MPAIATVLMLRPTESPVVFLQQLGRGLRRTDDKESLVVIDFIGNHRSFLLKPRTLLGAATGTRPSTAAVDRGDALRRVRPPARLFGRPSTSTPSTCSRGSPASARRARSRSSAGRTRTRKGDRPTAMQAWRAGHNPAAARSAHGGWFGLLDHLGLLGDDEAEVWHTHRDVLAGFEAEPVTKSYKLVTLKALLHDETLRSGSSITQLAWTSHRLVAGDPRLVADTRSDTAMPDPVGADEPTWRDYWRRWPLAAWAGELRGKPGRWFHDHGERFEPTFHVADQLAATFDAMVAELVDWRLARYLFTKQPRERHIRLRVSQSNGRPLVWLDREHNPGTADRPDAVHGRRRRVRGQLRQDRAQCRSPTGSRTNDLHELLRRWFGPSAGQPGTDHYVEPHRTAGGWMLQPAHDNELDDEAAGGVVEPSGHVVEGGGP